MHRIASNQSGKSALHFFVGGSVDDGKSTLLGRLMFEAGAITDDQIDALARDSLRFGSTGGKVDFALLVDGLEDERQQGITIDVAHRYFATSRRAFIVADTPGHEAYTRNTATGASTSDLALIVVDARRGLLSQSRRHMVIARMVGVGHVLLAVNKLDCVGWSRSVYDKIVKDFHEFARAINFASLMAIPLSALRGDNLTVPSANLPWYDGPTLLAYLEAIEIKDDQVHKPLRLPVQLVLRPSLGGRLYTGRIASGVLRRGDTVQVAISGAKSVVERLIVAGEEREKAEFGDAAAVELRGHLDLGRGDILAQPGHRPQIAEQFEAHLIWLSEQPLLPGRQYLLKFATCQVSASVTTVKYRVDVDSHDRDPANTLTLNEIGVCDIATATPVAIDRFAEFPRSGCFILIDRYSNDTVAAGTVDFPLRRGINVKLQSLSTTRSTRAALKAQQPCILWFTGLSGAGKSTIANLVEAKLTARGKHAYILDGDNVRRGLNKDLGFKDVDRVENIRRVGEVAKLFIDAGLIILCSFISPFQAERAAVRESVSPGEFIEIYVKAPLEVCEQRDPKGLYAKARAGELPHFTGIDSPYEIPNDPDLVLDTIARSDDDLAQLVIDLLIMRGVIPSEC
jgi:bifunctional enzyme CysN/CysC